MQERAFVSSFNTRFLDDMQEELNDSRVRVSSAYNYNYYEGLGESDEIGIDGYAKSEGDYVFVASSVVSSALVHECHQNQKIVGVFISEMDTESAALYGLLEKIGVDIVISNDPENTPSFKRTHSSKGINGFGISI